MSCPIGDILSFCFMVVHGGSLPALSLLLCPECLSLRINPGCGDTDSSNEWVLKRDSLWVPENDLGTYGEFCAPSKIFWIFFWIETCEETWLLEDGTNSQVTWACTEVWEVLFEASSFTLYLDECFPSVLCTSPAIVIMLVDHSWWMCLCLCGIMGVGWPALEEQVCNTNTVVVAYQAGFQFENESYFSSKKGRYIPT